MALSKYGGPFQNCKDPGNRNLGVTGPSRGIGAVAVIKLAEQGTHIIVNYVAAADAAEEVVEKTRELGVKCFAIQVDVSIETQAQHMFKVAMQEFGRLDFVISNSGIEHFGVMGEVRGDDIDRVLGTNVKGQYFVAQEAYKHLSDHGRLILTSSISAQKVTDSALWT